MRNKNSIKLTDIKKKNISREEFASELSPFSKMAQGIYMAENSDNENFNLTKKKKSEHKQKNNLIIEQLTK